MLNVMPPGFYNMDCMGAMKQFPDKFFDLAIVDPPYGICADKFDNGASSKRGSTAKNLRLNYGQGQLKNRILNSSDTSWDRNAPPKEYFTELFRVSKNQIIWGGNYFDLPPTRCVCVWDKEQPWENFSQVELAWTSFDYPAPLFKYSNAGGVKERGNKIHPTQKPVALYAWLVKKFAKQGMKVIDTHVGSASSLIAYHRAGLEYWGYEISPTYYQMAKERLNRECAQVNLFEQVPEEKAEQISLI